jgi:hypothetical protein
MKSKDSRADRLYFRLEFMRRDPRYWRDVANKKNLPPDYWLKTYGIPCPEDTLPKALRNRFGGRKNVINWETLPYTAVAPTVRLVGYSEDALTPNDVVWSEEAREAFHGDPRKKNVKTLTIKVNLLKDRVEIRNAFDELLDEGYRLASIGIKKRSRGLRLYPKYLLVFDLKVAGLSFSAIGRRINPRNTDPDATIRRAKDYFYKCKKIIESREYVNLP